MTITFTGGISAAGSITAGPAPIGLPVEIAVNAVAFDGTNDYLTRGADFTGNVDGQQGTLVFWLNLNGDDDLFMTIFGDTTPFVIIRRISSNLISVIIRDNIITNLVVGTSTNTRKAADDWICILISWDLSAALKFHLFFNDVDETNTSTKIEGTVFYTETEHSVGANTTGTNKLNGDVAQFYFNPEEYIDFTVENNRRKFVSANGKPVDLESDGSGPTSNIPILFLSGSTDSWHTNKGDGDGMTENGELTTALTSPSD